ncbi:phage tail tape measure protein [Variovorax sp. OV700]|uniref:phage tail tape measure protein n=1 Tax=Variovorax sp. OV700 TaxID=1882826 RepID=UPI00087DF9DF|nr:phage tail tape measure protein [Variovorax sp. OV700]SDI77874.1 phage tail tape measure protein, TP901 family, core region [Variovorax sp. OV700]
MASNNLQLQVILQAIDKATAPMRQIRGASGDAARALRDMRNKLKELNEQQKAVGQFREVRSGLKSTERDMQAAQGRVRALSQQFEQAGSPTRALTRDFNAARMEAAALGNQLQQQQQHAQQLRDKLSAAGVSTRDLSSHERRLRSEIESTSASIGAQTTALKRQGEQLRRTAQLKAQHAKAMMHTGLMAAGGAVGVGTGRALMRPLGSIVGAYAPQEDSATQLSASMMRSDGSVPEDFKKITELASRLGDRLPGTTAEFQEMMTMLIRQGMSAKTVLGGLGESASYLGVQLRMPVTQAAEFAAKMQDATRTTEADMMGLMDVLQRTYYLGVDSGNMLQGFTKMSPVLGLIRKEGLEGSKALAPLLVMMDQTGMAGESAGNAIRKVFQAGLDAKKLGKANAELQAMKAGFSLDFTDGKGKFGGIDQVFDQIEKIGSIKDDMKRTGVIKQVFGDDAETLQVINTLMAKGKAGYSEVLAKMEAQADLRQRVDKQLGTLSNVMEAAQGNFTNVLAEIGSTIAPQLKDLVNWIGEVSGKVREWVKANPELTATIFKVVAVVAALYTAIGGLMLLLAGVLGPMFIFKFLMASMGLPLGSLAGMLVGPLATGLRLVSGLFLTLGRALLMNPIGLIITAIAVSAYLIYKYWGPISAFFSGLWTSVTAACSSAWTAIKASFDGAMVWFGQLPALFQASLGGISAAILNWSPLGLMYTAFAGVLNYLGLDLPAKFTDFGIQMMLGLANGITGALGSVRDSITGAADAALGWFKEKLGIRSPSRMFMLAGNEISNGAAEGITEQQGRVRQAALAMAAAAAAAVPTVAGASGPGSDGGGAMFDRRPPITAAAAQRSVSFAGDSIQITIQATPGMDAQALARAVSTELDRRQQAKRATMMSELSDLD